MYPYIKRLLDLLLASIGLIFLWPVLLIIAILVKCESTGPVFYRGVRTGRFGKPFRIFKFRSMVVDAEKVGGSTTKDKDPRITKIGGFLRKYKLDELPQLLNVLVGEMSFIGPRPEVAEYTDLYSEEEKAILSVRPGITDYSSMKFNDLQAYVGDGDADEVFRREILPQKNALRLKYVRDCSFWVDLKILLQTIGIVFLKPFSRRKQGR